MGLHLEGDVVPAMTLPLSLRNWLAELILAALHDGDARRRLERVATSFDATAGPHASEVQERARRAWRVLQDRDLDARHAAAALDSAAALFDGGLFFEVHELLEPHWLGAEAGDRKAFQGLIQIAVGFQHLANGNVAGARALLRDGAFKVAGRRLHGLELDGFGRAVQACLRKIGDEAKGFDWSSVPRFPSP
jgi:predicted metal-dependent hydrolase